MKYKFYTTILLGLLLFGCKKYQNDSFYSTYTPEGRLTKGGVWACTKIQKNNGQEFILNDFQYFFDLKSYGQSELTFGMLNYSLPEHRTLSSWSFSEKKNILNFNGKWKIQKLSVDKMELVDDFGSTYFFTKKTRNGSTDLTPINNNLIGVPLHGVNSKISTLINYKNCNQISEITGTSTTSPLESIIGLSGYAIGGNASLQGSFNFQQNFNKIGLTTFWLKCTDPNAIQNYITIKINGQPCSFEIVDSFSGWHKISIEIQTPGLKQFSIPTVSQINGTNYLIVNGIDEIRFWEYE